MTWLLGLHGPGADVGIAYCAVSCKLHRGGRLQLGTRCSQRMHSGCGTPAESLHRVFEPFFSSKSQTLKGGTGLGFAIVYQVIRQCLGFVQVTSKLDFGTTVALYLPLATLGAPLK